MAPRSPAGWSALERNIDVIDTVKLQNLIRTDGPINPGNGGRPLINGSGLMAGINSVKVAAVEGIGFAIVIDAALPLVKELIANGRIGRGYLAPSVATITEAAASQLESPVNEGVACSWCSPAPPGRRQSSPAVTSSSPLPTARSRTSRA